MMKRFILIGLLLLLAQPVLHAQEEGSEFSATLGVNYWWADWSQDNFDSSGGGLLGPKLGLSYGRFGVGLVYLTGEFDLDLAGGVTADAKRQDLDVIAQYAILDFLSVGLGFKRMTYDFETPSKIEGEATFSGVGLGLSSSYAFGESGFMIYGAASYLPKATFDREFKIPGTETESDSEDAQSINIEAGVSYSLAAIPLSFDLAYRYQQISSDEVTDEFGGPIFEVSYTF